ncbi:beta family protein [Streptomyces sp. NRRL S-15]|uniref:beta family protein n=1 Tax=Streptomyces sp. NRRL S-15 TaxID=1463886 RepID=UPI002D218EE8|nr:hypothetical protein [Streptomyces sp. NRRL S-15]
MQGPGRGPDRAAVIRGAADRIVQLADFRGALASAGETWLRDCAGPTTNSGGTGSHKQWVWAGNVQHITHAVRQAQPPA